ncbi:large adhesin [Streptomyces sp. CBMAI 2042]|nr:large adhesin [Streptomyces sp. CBMAI 2042]
MRPVVRTWATPVPGGEAEGEDGPPRRVGVDQPGQPVGEVAQEGGSGGEPARGAAGDGGVRAARADRVRLPVLGDDPAAQVHERDGGVRDGDVGPGDEVAAGVDLDGYVGAAEPLGPDGLRALPDQPAGQQVADVAGHRRRGEPGEAGDGGAGDRPVVEDRAQHGAGAGGPAGGPGRRDVGAAQRGGAAGGRGQTLHGVFQVLGGSGPCGRLLDGALDLDPYGRQGHCGRRDEASPVERSPRVRTPEGLRLRSLRGSARSDPVTRRGAHALQVDMTSRRQVCGSLHGAQRSGNGVTRSNR